MDGIYEFKAREMAINARNHILANFSRVLVEVLKLIDGVDPKKAKLKADYILKYHYKGSDPIVKNYRDDEIPCRFSELKDNLPMAMRVLFNFQRKLEEKSRDIRLRNANLASDEQR
jgi:hypothetical protein